VTWRHWLLAAGLLILEVVLEYSVLTRIGLPGATPDLVTITVVAFALKYGPSTGTILGFAAGLALDLAQPADGIVGSTALILAILGFAVGSITLPDRPVLPAIGIVVVSAIAVVLATAALAAVLGSPRVTWQAMPGLVLSTAVYAGILAPFLVPAVWFLAARLAPRGI